MPLRGEGDAGSRVWHLDWGSISCYISPSSLRLGEKVTVGEGTWGLSLVRTILAMAWRAV